MWTAQGLDEQPRLVTGRAFGQEGGWSANKGGEGKVTTRGKQGHRANVGRVARSGRGRVLVVMGSVGVILVMLLKGGKA